MLGFLQPSLALIRVNLSSLPRRWSTSLSTVLSVALVVVVLLGFLAMANGFRLSLTTAGSDTVAVVLSRGALSEVTSRIGSQQLHLLQEAPRVARDGAGRALVSEELVVPVDVQARDTGATETVSLRGLGGAGLSVRPLVTLSAGRPFTPGTGEIIVGARLASDYRGLAVGDTVTFGRSRWTVVGHFTAAGSVYESEILADSSVVQSQFNRLNQLQSVRVALQDAAALADFTRYVEDAPQLGLTARSEAQYFAVESQRVSRIILWLGWPLAALMAFGAAIGAMTAMYSSVSERKVEIATVRALGFSRGSAFVGTLCEALALTLAGCGLGVSLAWLTLDGWAASTRGMDSTRIGFELAMSWGQVVSAVILSLAIGLVGGGLPALRAAGLPLRTALSGRG
ncbi:ABC transporter permease [Azospirillum sp. HJ39]|uniref:ABC transporter permease n=1 Tax=Azospirillum sp. HJ39 TaxID=3159496 RepID=UPI00355858E0